VNRIDRTVPSLVAKINGYFGLVTVLFGGCFTRKGRGFERKQPPIKKNDGAVVVNSWILSATPSVSIRVVSA
jgi:hypothetical protein